MKKVVPQLKKAAPKQIQRKASPPKRATTPRPIRQAANAISPGKGLDQWYGESPACAVDRNVFPTREVWISICGGAFSGKQCAAGADRARRSWQRPWISEQMSKLS